MKLRSLEISTKDSEVQMEYEEGAEYYEQDSFLFIFNQNNCY
jgi:hypothetical protein